MASVVSIQIRIDEGDSAAVLGKIEQGLASVGVQGETSLKQLGPAANEASAGLQRLGGHTTTSLDQVRLLSQEFGIRLPRAMENALARMPALSSALAGFSGGLLALGAVEVFAHMAMEVYDLEQKFLSAKAPVDEYYESLKKIRDLDFSNVRDIETAQARLTSAATQQADHLAAAAAAHKEGHSTWNPFTGITDMYIENRETKEAMAAKENRDKLSGKVTEIGGQDRISQIENDHALDATLSIEQRITAEHKKRYDLAAAERANTRAIEHALGNPVTKDTGATAERNAQRQADAEEQIARRQIEQEKSLLGVKAGDTERMAGLEGAAARRQKELNDELEITVELTNQGKALEAGLRVRQMRAQYTNEELNHTRELTDQSQKQADEATLAGLKGVPRVDAELNLKLGSINDAEDKERVNGQISPEKAAAYERERVAARTASNQKIAEAEAQFTERMQSMVDQRAEAEIGGFARITAAAQREKDAITKTFSESFGANGRGANDNDRAARDSANAAVDQSADAQRQQLRAKNAADDLQFDREAAQAEGRVREQGIMGWVASYRDGIAEIQAQEAQREAKLSEDLQKGEIEWGDYERRKADIEASANAEIQAQNQHLQQQIAGQLQQAFTNPVEYIKSAMEKMFFEILAGWIMRLDTFKTLFGSTMSDLHPGAASGVAGVGGVGGMLSHTLGLGGAVQGAGGRPSGTGGFIAAGTSVAPEYSSTASAAAVPASAGGTPAAYGGLGDAAVRSSTTSVGGSVSGDISAARGLYGQLKGAGILGTSSTGAGTLSSTSQDSTVPFADNGEGGGYAGYMTGSTDDMSIGAAEGDDSIGSQATQQATAMQNVGGGPGMMAGAAGDAALAYGAYQGGKGVYDSFFQGGAKGAMDGAMSGVEAGSAVGTMILPGLGTLIGGAIGGAAGLATNLVGDLLGESGKMAARDYYRKTLFPELEGIKTSFESGSGEDYLTAIGEANSKSSEGLSYMRQKWGGGAADWVNDNYLKKETSQVVAIIMDDAKGGKQYMTRSAAEFHTGGQITSFHDFATSSTEGFIHAKLGEGVVHDTAMQAHAPMVHAINSGANAAQMAAMYLQSAGGVRSAAQASGGDTHNHTWSTLDGPSTESWLKRGGADRIAIALNNRAGTYSGDSV